MLRSAILTSVCVVSLVLAGTSNAADDPMLKQVYQATAAGRLNDAQSMMNTVLRVHPNSGKAHFIEAELLAKEGYLANAEAELETAEHLAPGLPFANAKTVADLRQHIGSSHTFTRPISNTPITSFASAGGIQMGLLLAISALITAMIFLVRRTNQRNGSGSSPTRGPYSSFGFGSSAPLKPSGGMQLTRPAASGIGSEILGGIATGAPLDAGVVVGDTLMDHFTEGGRHATGQSLIPTSAVTGFNTTDLRGSDFGAADSTSLADNSTGGDDWN